MWGPLMIRRKLDHALIATSVFLLIVLSSGTLELFKDGGARDQGVVNRVEYHGVLNYLTAAWCVITVAAIFLHLLKSGRINISRARVPLIIAVYAAISCLWTANIFASLKAVLLLFLGTAAVSIYSTQRTSAELLRFLVYCLTPLVVGSLVIIWLAPAYGVSIGTHEGSWQGMFDHKNGLGSYSAISLCIFLGWRRAGGPLWAYIPAGGSLILSIGSQSFTSAAASVLIVVVHSLTALRVTRSAVRRSLPVLIVALAAVPIVVTAIPVFGGGFEIAGKGALFSGRGYIWSYLLEGIASNPLFGNGFNAYKNTVYSGDEDGALMASIGFLPGSAHNGFVEATHSMGVIGLVLALTLVIAPVYMARRSEYFMVAVYTCLCAIVINIFDTRLIAFDTLNFVVIYISCLASRQTSDLYP